MLDKEIKLKRGALTISLDAEYAWGRITDKNLNQFIPLYKSTKKVNDRLLSLFERYSIPVTWALVGSLLDEENISLNKNNFSISDYFPGITYDSLLKNKELNNTDNSLLFDKDLITKIKKSKVQHEIGSHTYSHIFTRSITNKDLIEKDILKSKEVFNRYNIKLKSIVFPKNQVDYLETYKKNNFKTYRNEDEYSYSHYSRILKTLFSQYDYWLGISPKVFNPSLKDGLISIPGSMLFRINSTGIKKFQNNRVLIEKGLKGIENAINQKKIFHLWFHPFNFAYKQSEHLHALEIILAKAFELKEKGELDILTMGDYANLISK